MVGGIIIKELNKRNKLNVLIITPAPTETIPQFTEDLFYKFKDFKQFKIHTLNGLKSKDSIQLNENNIIIASKQMLQKYINEETINEIKNLALDLIIFDENHFSGTTDISKEILNSYASNHSVKIYLTATYRKPLQEWNISHECQMYWDIDDERFCKTLEIDKLYEKHNKDYIDKTINYFNELGQTNKEIFQPYSKMPEIHYITNRYYNHIFDKIKENITDSKYGFSFDVLFSFKEDKTDFKFRNEIKLILRYISGSNKEVDFKNEDISIFSRINSNCSRVPFTQIWFLPPDNINEISKHLIKLMQEDNILKQYETIRINRKNRELAKDIKNDIDKKEIIAKETNKRGLILLAGNMLSLGITIESCDVVFLMNNTLSSDRIIQQMYRCMSEGENKKYGYIIDLNISRVLNTCVNYTIYNNASVEDKLTYLIKNHLINIDLDMIYNKNINIDKVIMDLMEIWKNNPINSFKMLLKNLDNEYIEFDTQTQKLLNKYFTQSTNDNTLNIRIHIDKDNDEIQELPSGKEYISNNQTKEVSEITEKKEIIISFTKDVLPFILPLTCILTYKNNNKDFIQMLNDIKEDKQLLEVFDEQCLIWWNKNNLINFIQEIVNKYDKNSNTYNIAIQFKMSLQSLIDRPKELLELIAECLKPKDIEKKQFGEVFTPISLVNEMLDNLPGEVWKNKDLKWLDPAVGMGNFPIAVYLRLIESLKDVIKNDNDRKKHILENMLYMCELNKKNVFICKQIFDINDEYKLNIYEGDSLILDYNKEFGVDKFDIIMGNPPYNKGGIRSHTGKQLGEKNETIWTKFVELSFKLLKPNGYLVFINPLSWLKKSHSLHNLILEKHILWMKLWDNSQTKDRINADIPISLYILKNFMNTHNKTIITSVLKRRNLISLSTTYLNSKYSIPLAYHNIFDKLRNFIEEYNLKLEYNTKTVKSIGTKVKIPLKYELEDMLAVDTFTIKEGIMVKKTTEMHPDVNKKKLIIANKSSFNGAFIDDGKLSLTGNHKFYIKGENLNIFLLIFKFKISDIISHYTKYGQDFLDNEAFEYIPDIRKLNITDIKEEEFYKLIGFTSDEINLINNIK